MTKPRVLLVMHALSRTGAPIAALRLFRAISADFDIQVVSRSGGPITEEFREAFPLTVLRPDVPGGNAIGRGRAAGHRAWRASWKPDLIYVNTVAALPTWSRMWSVRRHPAPVLLHVHEGPVYTAAVEREFPGLIADEPDGYVTDADWLGAHLQQDFGVPEGLITTVPPPVGDEFLAESALPHEGGGGPFVVGGAGAPSWMKGTELWLLTAAELARRDASGSRFRFRWVGGRDDDPSRQMASMVHKLHLEDRVELVSHTPDHKAFYGAMDVFLMSSWEDPSPVVVLEAMALGKVVACFKGSGGPPEEVGHAGIVVDEFSPTAMADAIEALADAPDKRASLAEAARERAREHFALDVVAGRLSEVISRSLGASAQLDRGS